MPEVEGYMKRMSSNQVEAHFDIDGSDYKCTLRAESQLPYFDLESAKLNYDNTGQLTGAHSLDGHVGKKDFATSFDNSSKIEGDLSSPIDQYSSFYGNAIWTRTM
ncbi:hypothetical protein AnigIFM49718_005263 [Aspergillus niger]|nr:hypothetical protein AnigIFM49718_005263 [Aspergillus niger]